MTGQMSFDDLPPLDTMVRAGGRNTSQDAAVLAINMLSRNKELALDALVAAGPTGLTDFELAAATGVAQTSIGKRRLDLVRAGLVIDVLDPDTGRPVTRPSPSGAASMVWCATPAGISKALDLHLARTGTED